MKTITAVAFSLILSACASTPLPPYAPPEGKPTATLINGIKPFEKFKGGQTVSAKAAKGQWFRPPNEVFSIDDKGKQSAVLHSVEAESPVLIIYSLTTKNQKECTIANSYVFKANKFYTLISAVSGSESKWLSLFDDAACHFGIIDNGTGDVLPKLK